MSARRAGATVRRPQRGFSLLELMVATVIALIASLAIFQTVSVSEERKRSTTSGSEGLQAGVFGLSSLERAVANAGYNLMVISDPGYTSPTRLVTPGTGYTLSNTNPPRPEFNIGCNFVASGNTYRAAGLIATDGGGGLASDSMIVFAGSSSIVPMPALAETGGLAAGSNTIRLRSSYGVNVGDGVTFATDFQDLGPTLLGKAFDDRGGCAVLCALLDQDYPVSLEAVFTVQEEVGLRGAQVAAHRLAPDCAIVLECGTTDDTPKERDDTPVMRLGAGPAITVMDRSLIADRRLVAHLVATADDLGIPYQIRAPKGGGTDGGRIHLSRAGVPTAVVSMPCRYLHAPASLLAKSDMRHTIALLRAALQRLSWKDLER